MIFVTNTGYGYKREIATGKIICKVDLPKGEHGIADGQEFVEVASRSALDAVIIDRPVPAKTLDAKINDKLREIAIAQLTTEGKLTAQELQAVNDAEN